MDDILIDLGGGRAPTSHDDITLSPFTTRKLGISTGWETPVSRFLARYNLIGTKCVCI